MNLKSREAIGHAQDSVQKLNHLLSEIVGDNWVGYIKDPLNVINHILTEPMDDWGDNEKKMFDWVNQCAGIMTEIDIAWDYAKKIEALLESIAESPPAGE